MEEKPETLQAASARLVSAEKSVVETQLAGKVVEGHGFRGCGKTRGLAQLEKGTASEARKDSGLGWRSASSAAISALI